MQRHQTLPFVKALKKADEYIKLTDEIRPGIDMNSTFRITLSRTNLGKTLIKRKTTKSRFKFSIMYQNKDRDHRKCSQIVGC